MSLYGNRPASSSSQHQQQQPQHQPAANAPLVSPAASSNSDSGIFRDDSAALRQTQQQQAQPEEPPRGASGGGLSVRAMPAPKNPSGDDSFNTERLDDQNSAENLRQSMHKYLQSKQSHLKTVSEQLRKQQQASSTRPLDESGAYEAIGPASTYGAGASLSMEDLSSSQREPSSVAGAAAAGLLSYLHAKKTSDSNLSQLSAEPVQQAPKLGQATTILRPGDQYPSEPGVLMGPPPPAASAAASSVSRYQHVHPPPPPRGSRPVSALSSDRRSVSTLASEDDGQDLDRSQQVG